MSDEAERVAMLSDLQATEARLKAHFGTRLAEQTARLDNRIDEQTARLDNRIDEQTGRLDRRIDEQTGRLDKRIDQQTTRLEARISEEGKTTRHHFDIMVEKVEAAVKVVAEVNVHHTKVLDDHETRLQKVEKAG